MKKLTPHSIRSQVAVAAAAVLTLGLLGATTTTPAAGTTPATADTSDTGAAATAAEQPNVVVIMTDDQEVASLDYMPAVQRLAARGVTFAKHTASFSLCCPSRSTYFLGQHAHNHNVRGNFDPIGGYNLFNTDEILPIWLQDNGYVTSHIGKYINGYDDTISPETNGVPRGWDDWHGGVDPTTYLFHNYLLNDNGTINLYGEGPENYQTDVLTEKAIDFIDAQADSEQPFYLNLAYLAPHWEVRPDYADINPGDLEGLTPNDTRLGVAPVPAERHADLFPDLKAPRPPSYDEADVSDKPAFVQAWPRLDQEAQDQIDEWYVARIRSLQAIDEGITQIEEALERNGELDNTYIIFTADNGFLQGEHRLPLKKVDVYDPSTRIPLVVSGPGVEAGGEVADWTSNVDIAATIFDITDTERPGATFDLDGVSLTPYLDAPDTVTGRVVMHEAYDDEGEVDYQAVRVGRWKYVRYATGETELYDLRSDPHELTSRHSDPATAKVIATMVELLDEQATCVGAGCELRGYGDDWDTNLKVRKLKTKQVGRNGHKLRVRAVVVNNGRTDVDGVRVVVKERGKTRRSMRIDLAAGERQKVVFQFRWKEKGKAKRPIAVIVDPKHKVNERTRTDNVVKRKVKLKHKRRH